MLRVQRRTLARQLHTTRGLLQQKLESKKQTKSTAGADFTSAIELGDNSKAKNGGRELAIDASVAWQELYALPPPDHDSLLPLVRDLNLPKRAKRLKHQKAPELNAQRNTEQVITSLKDVSEGLKLIWDLIRRRKKLEFVQKPTEAELNKTRDPLTKALNVESWEDLDEEMETLVSRVRNVKEGEELLIIGGGFSGLSLAYFASLARPDIKIKLLEESSRFGGWMDSEVQSYKGKNTVFEFGPRTLLPSHPGVIVAVQLMEQLGLLSKLGGIAKTSAANAKGMLWDGKLMQLPNSLGEAIPLFRSKFMSGMRMSFPKELFTKARGKTIDDESVESFISRRFGRTVADRMISPMMRGIYAGDISELSARSVTRMNKLFALERFKGTSIIGAMITGVYSSLDSYANEAIPKISQAFVGKEFPNYQKSLKKYSMIALDGGIEQLSDALVRSLKKQRNVTLLTNLGVKSLSPGSNNCSVKTSDGNTLTPSVVVSTLGANRIGPCLAASPEAQMISSQIKFANMAVVDFFFPGKRVGKNWFGFLVPKSQTTEEEVLGVIFDSAVRNSAKPIGEVISKVEEVQKPFVLEDRTKKPVRPKITSKSLAGALREQLTDKPLEAESEEAMMPADTTLTVMMGGHLWDSKKIPSEQELIDRAVAFLRKTLGEDISDYHVKVKINRECIPQYTVGHSDRVQRMHDAVSKAYNSRVFLAGTSFGRGVGLGDCLVDSLTAATRLSPQRKLLFPRFYVNHVMATTHPSLYA